MFSIVEIAGKQYKIEKGQHIYVDRLDAKAGDEIKIDKALFSADGDKVSVGSIKANVKLKVLELVKDKKVIVFKKKRRKGYKVKKGHRHQYTKCEVLSI